MGEEIAESYVVKKILRAVSHKFLQIASTIEEFGDLSTKTIEDVIGSLKAHEERLKGHESRSDDQVLLSRGDWRPRRHENDGSSFDRTRGRGGRRSGFPSQGFNQGYASESRNIREDNSSRFDISKVKCYACNEYGHYASDCKGKRKVNQEAYLMEQKEDEPALLMVEELELSTSKARLPKKAVETEMHNDDVGTSEEILPKKAEENDVPSSEENLPKKAEEINMQKTDVEENLPKKAEEIEKQDDVISTSEEGLPKKEEETKMKKKGVKDDIKQRNMELEQKLILLQLKCDKSEQEVRELSVKVSELKGAVEVTEKEKVQVTTQMEEYKGKISELDCSLNQSIAKNSELEEDLRFALQKGAKHEDIVDEYIIKFSKFENLLESLKNKLGVTQENDFKFSKDPKKKRKKEKKKNEEPKHEESKEEVELIKKEVLEYIDTTRLRRNVEICNLVVEETIGPTVPYTGPTGPATRPTVPRKR